MTTPLTLEQAALLGSALGKEFHQSVGDQLLGGLRSQVERQLRIEAKDRAEKERAGHPDQVRARIKQTFRAMRKAGVKI